MLICTSKLTLCALPRNAALLIRVITTVVVGITLPAERDALVVSTSEIPGTAWHRLTALLVTVVPAVIDAIAHGPLWDAAVVSLAAEFCVVVTVIRRGHAFVDGLVGIVSTVVVHITLPALRDAAAVVTPELAGPAGPAATVRTLFIRVVLAVVHRVTLPGLWDAALVGTLPFVGFTPVMLTESTVLIRAISTILLSIAQGLGACAVTILALELSQTAEAVRARVWFVGTIGTVFLSITFPPYGDTFFIVST